MFFIRQSKFSVRLKKKFMKTFLKTNFRSYKLNLSNTNKTLSRLLLNLWSRKHPQFLFRTRKYTLPTKFSNKKFFKYYKFFIAGTHILERKPLSDFKRFNYSLREEPIPSVVKRVFDLKLKSPINLKGPNLVKNLSFNTRTKGLKLSTHNPLLGRSLFF